MGKLKDIRVKLKAGSTKAQLIEEGYAPSSVYREARLLKRSSDVKRKPITDSGGTLSKQGSPSIPAALANDEEIIDLQKKVAIAELEAKLRSTKSRPYSPAVIDFFRSMQKHGYSGSIRSIIDLAVATIIVDHLENEVDGRLKAWALDLIGPRLVDEEAPKNDAVQGYIDTLYESARFELLRRSLNS